MVYLRRAWRVDQRTDARGVTVTRTVDALDRVTFVDYPDDSLDITYTYDNPSVPFSKGRLTQILREGHAVDYEYDRFGRTTQDGDLQFIFDKNGNREEIGYPDGVRAIYTYDFADREKSLDVEIPGSGGEPWVTDATYYPSGPLWLLDFAILNDPLGLLASDPTGCVTRWVATGAALGAGLGGATGALGGGASAGAACTLVALGIGTVGCGAAGGSAGAAGGADVGRGFGTLISGAIGTHAS